MSGSTDQNQIRTKTAQRPKETAQPQPVLKLLFSAPSGVLLEQRSFHGDELPVGRAVDPAIGLSLSADELASRVHFRLLRDGDRVILLDGGSKNGTFVNGQPSHDRRLEDRDVLRAGGSLFLFRIESEHCPDAPDSAEPAHTLLLGVSPEIAAVRHQIVMAAGQPESILILGETGTGKERAAQALHELSRRTGPLVACNTPQLHRELAAGELFGHERGAFTGAHQRRAGLFVEAEHGTLFLDELGELATDVQAQILRVLQTKIVRPVGGQERPVDVRVIAATNRDLEQAIAAGLFRADLRARLAAIELRLPPLRDRKEDILPLFTHYLGGERKLTANLAEALLIYRWPENVRELVNLTVHVRTFSPHRDTIDFADVAQRLHFPTPPALASGDALCIPAVPEPKPVTTHPTRHRVPYDQVLVHRLLKEHHGILTHVANALGVSRRQLARKLRDWQLNPKLFQDKQ